MELTTEQKLDALAEYHAQRDSIEAKKAALLNEVKIPAEVLWVQAEAKNRELETEQLIKAAVKSLHDECERQLSAIKVPDEVKALLAEIDHQRGLILAYQREREADYQKRLEEKRAEIFEQARRETQDVFDAVAKRKAEIEMEFLGKAGAVDDNIKALEAEIKADAKSCGKTVKGKYFMAVYVKGRVTWNTDMLDGMIALVPQLEKARKEGEPSVTLRKI
jgi:hypothetical protein